MHYAIIEICGTQFWLEPGKFYDLPKLKAKPGNSICFKRILLINNGSDVFVGKPFIGAKVCATVLSELKSPKILVYKMKSKKKYRRKMGHRDQLTRLTIDSILVNS
jgi:large subunit ribosomal protein L21